LKRTIEKSLLKINRRVNGTFSLSTSLYYIRELNYY